MTKDELIEKITNDPALLAKVSAFTEPSSLIAFAKEHGLDITEEEAKQALSLLGDAEGELGSESLSQVAGGRKC